FTVSPQPLDNVILPRSLGHFLTLEAARRKKMEEEAKRKAGLGGRLKDVVRKGSLVRKGTEGARVKVVAGPEERGGSAPPFAAAASRLGYSAPPVAAKAIMSRSGSVDAGSFVPTGLTTPAMVANGTAPAATTAAQSPPVSPTLAHQGSRSIGSYLDDPRFKWLASEAKAVLVEMGEVVGVVGPSSGSGTPTSSSPGLVRQGSVRTAAKDKEGGKVEEKVSVVPPSIVMMM
ncbi:hypothetical protein HDU93_002730, partial [Gonapodya sp. JEL0774]